MTETLDKLYLELSLITKARNVREIAAANELRSVADGFSDTASVIDQADAYDMKRAIEVALMYLGDSK